MNFNDNKAIYLQIADKLKDEIMAQKYKEEQRIPSVREYAAMVEVNANTVMRSYELLEREGIIFNRRGIGFFVSKNATKLILKYRKEMFYSEELAYFFSRLSSFGITPEELSEKFSNYLKHNGNEKNI